MPVRFKGKSDYKLHYKWFDSYRSKSFMPTSEQAAPAAGLETTQASLVCEPPIQRKKRIGGPQVSLSADYYEGQNGGGSEYALLGQQEKFASNVRYRPKSGNVNNNRSASPPKQLKLDQIDENIEKRRPPVVDTKQFTEPTTPPTPLAPRKQKEDVVKFQRTKAIQTKSKEASGQKVDKAGPVSVLKQTSVQSEANAPVKQGLKDKNLSDVLGEMKKKKPSMNEFAQTNMDKGIVDSAPEAPAEYSMKYKAGVAPPRASRKQSTYQREFEWKNRVAASPMIAAEQVVYNSKVGPVKTSGFPKTSEYKAQFKKWRAIENEPVPAVKHAAQQRAAMKNKTVKRSKSVGAADRQEVVRQTHDVEEPKAELPKPLAHHGKLRKVVTEYAANFKPPQKFNYEKGAWKGADPPHIYSQKPEPKEEKKEKVSSNWFAEVVELRRKAAEYKKRAQGTHFSREHLVQLLAKQAGFWDIPSARSGSCSTISALSLDAGSDIVQQQVRRQRKGKKYSERPLIDFDSCHATISEQSVVPDIEEEESEVQKPLPPKKNKNYNRKLAWLEEHQKRSGEAVEPVQDRVSEDMEYDSLPSPQETREGRLPTPVMRQGKVPKKMRHHLDLTTPAVGGAILTSPPPQMRTRSFGSGGSSQDTEETEAERRQFGKTYNLNRLQTTPTFGHPSEDTHVLRDDNASTDQPLKPKYMYAPVDEVEDLQQENQDPEPVVRRQSRRKEHMRPAGVPSTLQEEMADTYNKHILNLPPEDNDDAVSLSLSVRSIASSCSLASDVYERAKNRRDNFWGKSAAA